MKVKKVAHGLPSQFVTFCQKLKPKLPKIVRLAVVSITFFLGSGFLVCLLTGNPSYLNVHLAENIVVASTYLLAFWGLFTMYESARCKNKKKRWLLLLTGAFTVFIAWQVMETLWRVYGGT